MEKEKQVRMTGQQLLDTYRGTQAKIDALQRRQRATQPSRQ